MEPISRAVITHKMCSNYVKNASPRFCPTNRKPIFSESLYTYSRALNRISTSKIVRWGKNRLLHEEYHRAVIVGACIFSRHEFAAVNFSFFFFSKETAFPRRYLFHAGNNNFDITGGFHSPGKRSTAFFARRIYLSDVNGRSFYREREYMCIYLRKNDPFCSRHPTTTLTTLDFRKSAEGLTTDFKYFELNLRHIYVTASFSRKKFNADHIYYIHFETIAVFHSALMDYGLI